MTHSNYDKRHLTKETNMFETLPEIRQQLEKNRKQATGTTCPCCDQHVEEYTRNLNPSSVAWLLALYLSSAKGKWFHSRQISKLVDYRSGGEFSIMKWWNLITTDGTVKRASSGFWRLRLAGREFCRGSSAVYKTVRLYNDTLIRFEGPVVDVRRALKKTPEEYETFLAKLSDKI